MNFTARNDSSTHLGRSFMDAEEELFPFDDPDTQIYAMTPESCIELVKDVSEPHLKMLMVEGYAAIEAVLPFGTLLIQSAYGLWSEDFESEVLAVYVEFSDVYHNNQKGLESINQLLTYSKASNRNGKLRISRAISMAGGRSRESLQHEIANVYQDSDKLAAMLYS